MNDSILKDIEKDISEDWNNIQKSILKKIDYMNNSSRFNMPDYNQFILLLKEIVMNKKSSLEIIEIIEYILSHQYNEECPRSFNKIWKMFCDPEKYGINNIKCNKCGAFYDVIYKKSISKISYKINERFSFLNYESVFCMSCGDRILNITCDSIMGIYASDKTDENSRKSRYSYYINEFRNSYQNY